MVFPGQVLSRNLYRKGTAIDTLTGMVSIRCHLAGIIKSGNFETPARLRNWIPRFSSEIKAELSNTFFALFSQELRFQG